MKNLIFTFVITIVSLVSFSQNVSINYVGGDSTGIITIIDDINPTIKTIYVNGNVKFELPANQIAIVEKESDFSTPATSSTYLSSDSLLPIIAGQTKYLLIYIGSVGSIGYLTVIFPESLSTSESILIREELKVYPSLATSEIKISFSADKSNMPLNIFSLDGQLIYQDTQSREVGSINTLELNVSDWKKGLYLIKTETEVVKFIVQ